MPEYICECCNYKTNIKCKLESHLETKKHLSKVNIMEEDKDEIIQKLREENMYLKGKVEVFEMMFREKEKEKPVQAKTNCEPFVDEFLKSLELEVNETLIESIAELRTNDDKNEEINNNNVFDVFVFNEKNNLPYIKEFSDIKKNEHVLADIVIEKVLNKCSIDITEPYKGRFKLYSNDKWLEVAESREIVFNMMNELYIHYKKYLKLLKVYYTYDSTCKCIDEDQCHKIQPLLKSIQRKLNDNLDTEEEIKYILNKVRV
jgi:hypothetical protein